MKAGDLVGPANYAGDFEKNLDGTAPFERRHIRPNVGASVVRNEAYWGEKALPARTEFTFFADIQPDSRPPGGSGRHYQLPACQSPGTKHEGGDGLAVFAKNDAKTNNPSSHPLAFARSRRKDRTHLHCNLKMWR
jgi:hypothetical protein